MTAPASQIVQKLWNFCNVLRDDGLSYGDYLEQLTYLLFLKMDDEGRAMRQPSTVPRERMPSNVLKGGLLCCFLSANC